MQVSGDALLVFYGDYDANTGPIHLLSVDLAAPDVLIDLGTLTTEATWNARERTGEVLVPYVDPQGGQSSTGHYAHRVGGVWTINRTITPAPEHLMDAAITSDALWLSGSSYGVNPPVGGAAGVWRSTDGGSTWALSLNLDSVSDTGYARVYLLLTFGDELLALVTDSSAVNSAHHWNGSTWTQVADVGALTDGVEFNLAGTPYWICRGGELNFGIASPQPVAAVALDPTVQATITAALPAGPVSAMCSTANHAWLLTNDGTLHRVDPDGTVTALSPIIDIGDNAAMAVDEARRLVYLAGASSTLTRVALPA